MDTHAPRSGCNHQFQSCAVIAFWLLMHNITCGVCVAPTCSLPWRPIAVRVRLCGGQVRRLHDYCSLPAPRRVCRIPDTARAPCRLCCSHRRHLPVRHRPRPNGCLHDGMVGVELLAWLPGHHLAHCLTLSASCTVPAVGFWLISLSSQNGLHWCHDGITHSLLLATHCASTRSSPNTHLQQKLRLPQYIQDRVRSYYEYMYKVHSVASPVEERQFMQV